jgi:hypothetical protein
MVASFPRRLARSFPATYHVSMVDLDGIKAKFRRNDFYEPEPERWIDHRQRRTTR